MKELPKRGRGRPSKAALAERERLQAEQEAEYAASLEAAEETYLDEQLAKPFKSRSSGLTADEATIKLVFSLAKIAATQEEIAAVLSVPKRTFGDFMAREPDVREAWESGLKHANISLRRKQFRLADKLAPMAIFLGKNMLGQKDVHEVKNTTGKDAAAEMTRDQLLEIIEKGKAAQPDPKKARTLQ